MRTQARPVRLSERVRLGPCCAAVVAWMVVAAGSVPEASSAEPTAGYQAIQRAFLREEFEQVTSLAQTFILQHPDVPEVPRVWLWLSLSLDRLGQSHEALRELDRLKARLHGGDPMWPELLFWEGDISRRAFQTARARSAYRRLVAQHPESTWTSQARLGLGLIGLQEEEFASAIEQFHEVASRHPDTPVALDAVLFEGLCHLQLKQFDDAVAILAPLLGQLQEPNTIAQAAFYLGEGLTALGQYQDAARAYQRALESATTAQWGQPAQFGLGWAYYQANRCEESVRAFEPYLAQAAEHRTEALFAQASCLVRLGQEAGALALFEQIVSRDPEHPLAPESALVLVDAHRRQGRYLFAKELLHAFLRRPLGDWARAQVQLRLGAIALEQGNPAQAKTIFTLAADHPEPSIRQAALSGLGDVEWFLGNPPRAQPLYEQAVRLAEHTPLAVYARYQLGRIHLERGALEQAAEIFQKLVAGEESALADDARLALVIVYLNQKKEPLARALLEAIRRQRPASQVAARAAYYEALLALGQGDEAAAQQLCQQLLTEAPSTEEAFEARLLLADLQAQLTSPREVMQRLQHVYDSEPLARSHRAKLAKRIGDFARADGAYPEAIRWYERAGELAPSLAGEAAYRIASCYEEAGDAELAITWYRKAEQAPWRVRGQLAAAKLLERQDRPAEATAIYRRLAEEPIPEAKLIRERLAALGGDDRMGRGLSEAGGVPIGDSPLQRRVPSRGD